MTKDVKINEAGLVEFLQALVRIPSINPPGQEGPAAELVASRLRQFGLAVEIFGPEPSRPSVVARLKGTGGGPTLLLNGHTDVQPAGSGWKHDPFGGEIEGTRLYGRGSIDMKAGIAAMVYSVEAIVRAGLQLKGDLLITAVADEVGGGHQGTGFLVRSGKIKADMAVVCEPTGDSVNVAHRGTVWIDIEVRGKSAHGGRPWLGVNAISKIAKIARAIEDELVPSLQDRKHPLLPAPTINLGTIHGGNKFNLVADHCVLQVDRRTVPGETVEEVLHQMEEICAVVRKREMEPFEYSVREVMHVTPAEISPENPIVIECKRAYREILGTEPGIGSTAGFEDMHFLMDAGIPTAMFGPYRRQQKSDPAFFTTSGMADEYVDIPDVVTAVRIYTHLIQNILG